MDSTVDTDGFAQLVGDFTSAPLRLQVAAGVAVATTVAQITATAKTLVDERSGRLAASIDHETTFAGPVVEGASGPTMFYGWHVEHGNAQAGPRPYMGPALDEHAPAFVKMIAAAASPF